MVKSSIKDSLLKYPKQSGRNGFRRVVAPRVSLLFSAKKKIGTISKEDYSQGYKPWEDIFHIKWYFCALSMRVTCGLKECSILLLSVDGKFQKLEQICKAALMLCFNFEHGSRNFDLPEFRKTNKMKSSLQKSKWLFLIHKPDLLKLSWWLISFVRSCPLKSDVKDLNGSDKKTIVVLFRNYSRADTMILI